MASGTVTLNELGFYENTYRMFGREHHEFTYHFLGNVGAAKQAAQRLTGIRFVSSHWGNGSAGGNNGCLFLFEEPTAEKLNEFQTMYHVVIAEYTQRRQARKLQKTLESIQGQEMGPVQEQPVAEGASIVTTEQTSTEETPVQPHAISDFSQKDIKAGRAIFTLVSLKTQVRFTYKVSESDRADGSKVYYVSVLRGTDNESDYSYMGMIEGTTFRTTYKSRVSPEAASFKAFSWLWKSLGQGWTLDRMGCEVWHEGICLRCGRALTVPESIETGYGPICAGKLQQVA